MSAISELLQHPNIDVNAVDELGNTALHYAAAGTERVVLTEMPVTHLDLRYPLIVVTENKIRAVLALTAGGADLDVMNKDACGSFFFLHNAVLESRYLFFSTLTGSVAGSRREY